jgi:peptide-methionine (R)-S-oxide reductase
MRRSHPSGVMVVSLAVFAVMLCGGLVLLMQFAKTEFKLRGKDQPATPEAKVEAVNPWAERIAALDRYEFAVTQRGHHDVPGAGRYVKTTEPGIYIDVVSREPLFSSADKKAPTFGYAEFSKPLDPASLVEEPGKVQGEARVLLKSKAAGSQLGWVVRDEAGAAGTTYVINSSALKFVPLAELDAAGLGHLQFKP